MCDMTHSYVRHDSFICVPCLIHMCDMTHSYMLYYSRTHVTRLLLQHAGCEDTGAHARTRKFNGVLCNCNTLQHTVTLQHSTPVVNILALMPEQESQKLSEQDVEYATHSTAVAYLLQQLARHLIEVVLFLHKKILIYTAMGWLRLVGSSKIQVSFAEYRLFYRILLQERPILLRSLLIVANPYVPTNIPYKQPRRQRCLPVAVVHLLCTCCSSCMHCSSRFRKKSRVLQSSFIQRNLQYTALLLQGSFIKRNLQYTALFVKRAL